MTDQFSTPDDDPTAKATSAASKNGTNVDGDHVDVPRDGYGRYMIPDPMGATDRSIPWTRATTFAKSISDTFTLSAWSQRMVAKGLAMRPDLYALAASTPLDDKKTLNQIAEQAKEAAGAKAAAALGTALHAFSEQTDRGESPYIPPPWDADVRAYQAAMAAANLVPVPEYIEQVCIIPKFGVAGTFDRILRLADGSLVIGDLKTGRDLSYGWPEIAIQLALYAHATHIFNVRTGVLSLMPVVSRKKAIVMHLPVGKETCTLYEVDIEAGWEASKLCHEVRNWRKTRKLARVLEAVQVSPSTVAPAYSPEWLSAAAAIGAARSTEDLSRIRKVCMAAGTWDDELLAIAMTRKAEFDQPV